MLQSLRRRILWFALLSLLPPPTFSSCEAENSVIQGSCGAGLAAASVGAGVLCAATLGLGCGVAVAAAAVSGMCASGGLNRECGDGAVDLGPIVVFLERIEQSVNELNVQVTVGFFQQLYVDAFQSITKALDSYNHNVIGKSSKPGNFYYNF